MKGWVFLNSSQGNIARCLATCFFVAVEARQVW
jgi:hypothetical protein